MLDESHANLNMTSEYARAPSSKRAVSSKPHCRGTTYSMIGAISTEGIEAMMYVEGSIDGHIFEEFVKKCLFPVLTPGKYLVLDNARIHRSHEVIKLIRSTGAKIVFLPPYSPDFSPIENAWSKIKGKLKNLKARTTEEFARAVKVAVKAVTGSDCEEWFEHCGYNVNGC